MCKNVGCVLYGGACGLTMLNNVDRPFVNCPYADKTTEIVSQTKTEEKEKNI